MTLQKKGQNRDSCDSDSRSWHNPKSGAAPDYRRGITMQIMSTSRVQTPKDLCKIVQPKRRSKRLTGLENGGIVQG